MTFSPFQEDFVCGLCDRAVTMRWNRRGPDETIPPICWYCEREYTRRVGKPTNGSLRDRREAMRLCAAAEALHCEASRMRWEKRIGWA